MAFSYNTTIPGARDQVRLLIGDTASTNYTFEDAELDLFLSIWSQEVHRASAQALRSLAANRAKLVTYWAVRGVTVDRSQQVRLLMEMADKLEGATGKVPYEFESTLDHSISAYGVDDSVYPDSEA